MENNHGRDMSTLPEGCIANVLSFTSPREACYFSSVSSLFNNASLSDTVWDRFLPHDHYSIISQSSDPSLLSSSPSKKDLFLSLCQKPIIIDNGKRSLALDKWSGKKIYMISARDLKIVWGCTPTFWRWNPDPDSRFAEAAELIDVCWLEICGKISTKLLSPSTLYSAYLVFKLSDRAHGLYDPPAEATVGLVGDENERSKRKIYLDTHRRHLRFLVRGPVLLRTRGGGLLRGGRIVEEDQEEEASQPCSRQDNGQQFPEERGDGWLEVELGEFFNNGGNDEEVEVSVLEVKGGGWKGGLVVEGIEIRPKQSAKSHNDR